MNFQDFKTRTIDIVTSVFNKEKQFPAKAIVLFPSGEIHVMESNQYMDSSDKKEALSMALREACKRFDVKMISFASEGFLAPYSIKESENPEFPKTMPADHPHRKDILFLTFESIQEGRYEADLFIYNVDYSNPKAPKLSELEHMQVDENTGGYFMNILK